jgi:endonuclease YncB( thermonuclease family)
LLALLWPGLSLAQTCPRPELNVGPAVKVHSRLEIELQDGRLIRTPHLAPFEASTRGAARMEQARAALRDWAKGEALALPQRLPLADRWGRIVTPAFLASGQDLGLRLVAQGLVRVGPAHTDPCLIPLLAAEIQARKAKLGLWADPYYSVLAADNLVALMSRTGEFVLVEGRILRLGQTSARFYLDFGQARGVDLSVTISKQAATALAAAGVRPESLPGRRVRVRGLLEYRPGPSIDLTSPLALEMIGR